MRSFSTRLVSDNYCTHTECTLACQLARPAITILCLPPDPPTSPSLVSPSNLLENDEQTDHGQLVWLRSRSMMSFVRV